MAKQIFRGEALERLASPEQLDQLMPLTSPRAWIALAAVGVVLMMALVWALFGTWATTVEGYGVLARLGGVRIVSSPWEGTVVEVLVRTGDVIKQGDALVRVIPMASRGTVSSDAVTSPAAGRVVAVAASEGESVKEGATLLVIESLDYPLQAVVYVPTNDGYRVEAGMEVQVLPTAPATGSSRCLRGRVQRAGRFPATRESMMRTVHNEGSVNQFLGLGPTLEVVAGISGNDSAEKLFSHTPCRAQITIEKKRPIQLILPGPRS